MKKVYNAPKAEKLAFEAKDIITASHVLTVRSSDNDSPISQINWTEFTGGSGN